MRLFRRHDEPAGGRTVPVGTAEQRWIADNLELLQNSGIDVADANALGDLYDVLLTGWLAEAPGRRPDPNANINLIGIGLGEHLLRRTGALSWAIVEADTTELALHGQPGDILIYPTNAVAKRWTAQETGFLPGFAEETAAAIARLRGTP